MTSKSYSVQSLYDVIKDDLKSNKPIYNNPFSI